MVPLTTFAIAGGIEASFALPISERLAAILLKASAVTTHASIVAMDWASRLPHSFLYTGRPSVTRMVAYFVGLAVLCFLRPRASRAAKFILLAALQVLMIVPVGRPRDGLLRLTFLYVGDGDAVLVEAPNGETTLIDAGPNTEVYGQAQNQVIRLAAMKGMNSIDRVVITHAHDDHYGGVYGLFDNVKVGEILVGDTLGEAGYADLMAEAKARGVRVRPTKRGDQWRSGEAVFEVLHPTGAVPAEGGAAAAVRAGAETSMPAYDANAMSVVIRLEYRSVSFLLTGDVTPEVQAGLPRTVTCTVLKAPHHGALRSIDPGFLRRLGASIAVVSAGSKFGTHPSPTTLAMLAAEGMATLITSRDGAVTVITDGLGLEVEGETGASHLQLQAVSPAARPQRHSLE
jgi:competence protein ComEC